MFFYILAKIQQIQRVNYKLKTHHNSSHFQTTPTIQITPFKILFPFTCNILKN